MTKINPKKYSYSFFNAADDALIHEIDKNKFETSLLYNILFQDKLVLLDTYFYNSSYLHNHSLNIRPSQTSSLFIAACKNNIVVPALRNKKSTSLVEDYDFLKQESYKKNPEIIPDNFDKIENLLNVIDASIDKNSIMYWPDVDNAGNSKSLGQSYLKLVSSILAIDKMPECKNDNEDAFLTRKIVWERTKKWRLGVFDKLRRRYENQERGLTRSDFFTEIASSFEYLKNPKKAVRFGYLENKIKDPNDLFSLKILYRWLNHCHHINYSQRLETGINLMMYDTKIDYLADNYFIEEKSQTKRKTLTVPVEMCPTEILMNVDVNKLMEIRNDEGITYRNSLREYSINPSPSAEAKISSSLQKYTSRLSRLAKFNMVQNTQSIVSLDDLLVTSATGILGVCGSVFNEMSVESSILTACSGILYPIVKEAIFEKKNNRKEKLNLEINIPVI